jgi:hypothetical protein
MPRLSKIGAAALAAFGWTSGANAVTASYVQVAGGGAGGASLGGGGGAGGYLAGTTTLSLSLSYTVTVGAGGAGTIDNYSPGINGSNSQFSDLTASVGGGGGAGCFGSNGQNGGSGGGASSDFGTGGQTSPGTGTVGQGNNGGNAAGTGNYPAGGGGGASAVGSNGSGATGGAGGAGTASLITGSSVTYATGGTGGTYGVTNSAGANAIANRGNGGNGGSTITGAYYGGNGGSGVVIISYLSPQKFGGGIVTTDGTNTIHTFQTSGTLSPLSTLSANYLIVAGGGGGGSSAASVSSGSGGGAGGLLSGSGVTIDTNSTYLVTVGSGGAGGASGSNAGVSGSNSSFSMVSTAAVGGGFGTNNAGSGGGGGNGGNGGSGGGSYATAGTGTAGQGNNGGANAGFGGGGGGASAVGAAGSGSAGGAGGDGTASSISGTSVTYAGGGGGSGPAVGAGGSGGGGAGGYGVGVLATNAGVSGTAGLGGGGGGSYGYSSYAGGSGGSGIVIISYAGATQLMAGGTVTITGGNVIHTFTSSGYLTPLDFVGNSLRFRSSATAFLNRTPTTAGNKKTFTISMWVKRGSIGTTYQDLFEGYTPSSGYADLQFSNTDNLLWYNQDASTVYLSLFTTAVYRDPAAWYHIVANYDSTQATASDRAKLYVNGTQVTSFSTATYPALNVDSIINSTTSHFIGKYGGNSNYFDGYMAEVNFIDGQALTPNSFGTFNSYGVWQPITYGGSYGTNGFYLPFTNTASTTTLGYDFSPQGNNWTTNNISLTAGSTYDSMTDVPTLTSATVANYCVLNPLDRGAIDLSAGNLTFQRTSSTADWEHSRSTIQLPSSSKWYWECRFNSGTNDGIFNGVTTAAANLTSDFAPGTYAGFYGYSSFGGGVLNNNSSSTLGSSLSNGDVIMIAVDTTNTNLWIGVNGTWLGSGNPATNTNASIGSIPAGVFPTCGSRSTGNGSVNFGQQPFVYTPPTNFVAINTFNL